MTQFWFGFISAVALIFGLIIYASLIVYHRGERKRQQAVDAIMAKVASQPGVAGVDTHFIRHPDILAEEQASNRRNPQGKKGIH